MCMLKVNDIQTNFQRMTNFQCTHIISHLKQDIISIYLFVCCLRRLKLQNSWAAECKSDSAKWIEIKEATRKNNLSNIKQTNHPTFYAIIGSVSNEYFLSKLKLTEVWKNFKFNVWFQLPNFKTNFYWVFMGHFSQFESKFSNLLNLIYIYPHLKIIYLFPSFILV